jgi:hypothetical protein
MSMAHVAAATDAFGAMVTDMLCWFDEGCVVVNTGFTLRSIMVSIFFIVYEKLKIKFSSQ